MKRGSGPTAWPAISCIGKWGDGSNAEYRLHLASGVIRMDLFDNSAQARVSAYTTSSQASLIGSWHHLAVTYDGRGGATAANGITIYIDGVAVPLTRVNNPAYVAMENLTATMQIGRESNGWRQYDGGLDEMRLWNVARTPSEIQSYMTVELSGAEAGLVAYWKLNEGTGTTVADDSPANHTATLFNGPAWVSGGPMGPAGRRCDRARHHQYRHQQSDRLEHQGHLQHERTGHGVGLVFARRRLSVHRCIQRSVGHRSRRYVDRSGCKYGVPVRGQGHGRSRQSPDRLRPRFSKPWCRHRMRSSPPLP